MYKYNDTNFRINKVLLVKKEYSTTIACIYVLLALILLGGAVRGLYLYTQLV